ncbi:PstS family phosphate ABC transporter substrate-binding protein (plasmid) [Kovacikia minuta CCNUW1]|uniref:PstS family phosphate ABC transporter substrate-binding protein n=1 Tax=Kovacikia minuta TaxID=2931930 RepID=UPI001CD03AB3|nr:PstS family phosphate ABC transporter substrate-binding protein [Kovacikia minuta]UBF30606.1 PstS family phosphate ABC transporter substrate-binding protein [Kovacikia minuta CCNUW1]
MNQRQVLLLSLSAFTLSISACSSIDEKKSQVSIDGGAVGYPLHQAVAEEYHKVNSRAQISVASSGTGGGISKFCAGEIDIVGASRPIKEEEIKRCDKKQIQFIELPVAIDGIAVIVNAKNNYIQCLSISELNDIWNPKSKITNWNQVNQEFPDIPLKLYAPASDTGTFDYFTQAVTGKAKASRTDYTPSHNQNVLVQGVAGDKGGLGYVGINYYSANKDKLHLLRVQSPITGTCEKPVPLDTVANNLYTPLSRPLFIYVSKPSLDSKPAVREFVNFYIDNSKQWVEGAGYVKLPDEAYGRLKQKFESNQVGTKFKDAKPGKPITDFI